MGVLLSAKTWLVEPGSMHRQILIVDKSAPWPGQPYCHHEAVSAVKSRLEPKMTGGENLDQQNEIR